MYLRSRSRVPRVKGIERTGETLSTEVVPRKSFVLGSDGAIVFLEEKMYKKVSTDMDFVSREKETLAFWKENRVFEKSVARAAPRSRSLTGRPRRTASRTSGTC